MVKVGRETQTLRFLDPEVVCQSDHRDDSSHVVDMQVLVESLRSAESVRIARPEIDVVHRIETQIGPRAENHPLDKIVLVKPAT